LHQRPQDGFLPATQRPDTIPTNEDRVRYIIHDVWRKYNCRFHMNDANYSTPKQYDAGVLGGVLLHPPFLDAIGRPQDVWTIPMITASYDLAACVTAVAIVPFTFRLGRRGTILLGNLVAIFGAVVQASSYSVGQLIAGRLLTGFAIGCISSAVPTYLSETGVEVGDRGPANAFNAILLISGVPLAYWIDYGFTKMYTQASWRVPIVLQCAFAFFSGGIMWFLPGTSLALNSIDSR
jgi:MFS family permease